MITNIEFFVGKDGRDIVLQSPDGSFCVFSESNIDLIQYLYERISDDYPEAFTSLKEIYKQSFNFKFLMVRRFIKCNFGILDEKCDLQFDGTFRMEFVQCPLRGECRHELLICQPKFNTTLSIRELEVVKLIAGSLSDGDIANRLFISEYTVANHRKNILRKLKLHSKSEIVDYCHRNNII